MIKSSNLFLGLSLVAAALVCSCSSHSDHPAAGADKEEQPVAAPFAKGADVSWVTQMESEGIKFYNSRRQPVECMKLLRDECSVNSIRLRVWVNPADGWNGTADVVAKARRAHDLGLRTMIDFHFSNTWADPGHQVMPVEWKDRPFAEQVDSLGSHVESVLTAIKRAGVTPEWVQIGNETTPGMMLPVGSVDNPVQLTKLNNAGYDAVKRVFPDAKVIVHLDQGHDRWRYDRMLGLLEKNGGKYDMIGMSLYPSYVEEDGRMLPWQTVADRCIENINYVKSRYKRPVMICEIGMPYDQPGACRDLIARMMTAATEGIFYWEPEAPAGYNGGYTLGCFDNSMPTVALSPFTGK